MFWLLYLPFSFLFRKPKDTMKIDLPLVVIESPFSGGKSEFVAYAKRALRDSLDRGEAPLASHLLHPQVYNDASPVERAHGMAAGHAWIRHADKVVVYNDMGITFGMMLG